MTLPIWRGRRGTAVRPAPGSWQHDLVELLETLAQHGVPYLVVGGYAVAHAGHLRATKDLDVFVPRSRDVDDRLVQALSEFDTEQARQPAGASVNDTTTVVSSGKLKVASAVVLGWP